MSSVSEKHAFMTYDVHMRRRRLAKSKLVLNLMHILVRGRRFSQLSSPKANTPDRELTRGLTWICLPGLCPRRI